MRSWLARLRARVKYRRFDNELAEELEAHRAMKETDLVAGGLNRQDAHWRAVRELGNTTIAREDARAVWIAPWIEGIWQDVRHALRLLARNRSFTIVASVTLALGIGANTVIFSVVDAAFFRPLPYKDPDRLVDVFTPLELRGGGSALFWASGRHAERLRAIKQVFEGVEAFSGPQAKALAGGSDQSPWVGAFTPTFPAFLGVSPQLGRGFTLADAAARDVIVISDTYWQRAFSRDPGVLGKTLAFSDQVCTIVGVMPSTFRYFVGAQTDAWLPLAERDGEQLAARLRLGLTVDRAQRELTAALSEPERTSKPLQIEISQAEWNRGREGARGQDSTRTMLFSLFGAVGLLLVIACANVANLLLARTLARHREIAIRSAVGATRFHLIRQFVIEALVLAGLGGVAATVLVWWGIKAIPAMVPRDLIGSVLGVSLPQLDVRVLVFGCLTAIVTGVFCGIVPGVRASHAAAAGGVLAGGQAIAGWSRGQRRLQAVFQALQVAMTLVLLAGAGLLIASFLRMVTMPAGFDPENLAYASLTFPRESYAQPPQQDAFFDLLITRITAAPGVRAATVGPPPVYGEPGHKFLPDDRDGRAVNAAYLEAYLVRPDYFRVAGIPLKEGRTFGPEDRRGAPPVAVISENAARRFWPGQSAIGRRFRPLPPGESMVTVVGVVPHVRTINLRRDGVEAYYPTAQTAVWPGLLVRVSGDTGPVIAAIRAQVKAIDPRVTVPRIGLVANMFAEFSPIASSRFYALLLGLFAGLALVTAVIGLYGLLSYSVSRRTHEIGIRVALGASLAQVRWLVVADALVPVVAGIAGGLAAAMGLSRLVASQLFQIEPSDPMTLTAVTALFVTVCVVAVFVPVRRATLVDPAETLRVE